MIKKIIIGLASLLIVILIIHQMFVAPVLRGVSNCYKQASSKMEVSSKTLESLPQNDRLKYFCDNDNLLQVDSLTCLHSINETSFVAPIIYKAINAEKYYQKSIVEHNKICPNEPFVD